MSWNPIAWQAHLRLACKSHSYMSSSASSIRVYWANNGSEYDITLLDEITGECRTATLTEAQRVELLFGHKYFDLKSLFASANKE